MSSSSDLETSIAQQVEKKKSPKKKTKSTPVTADHDKNEGEDPHWAYEPPEGAVLLDHAVDSGPFDWDAVEDDDDTEIWLIRVPESIKAKHFEGLEIDPPSSSRTARIGALVRKHATYDVWSVGDDDDDAETAGGEELRGLACLLPRRHKGKLYIAPKSVTRHIVVLAQPSIATAPEHQPVVYQNPPRPSYPKDVLKHAFVPYGARSKQARSEDPSIDDEMQTLDKPPDTAPRDKSAKHKKSKGKKRKVEGESPKKSKRHKTNT